MATPGPLQELKNPRRTLEELKGFFYGGHTFPELTLHEIKYNSVEAPYKHNIKVSTVNTVNYNGNTN